MPEKCDLHWRRGKKKTNSPNQRSDERASGVCGSGYGPSRVPCREHGELRDGGCSKRHAQGKEHTSHAERRGLAHRMEHVGSSHDADGEQQLRSRSDARSHSRQQQQ